MIGSVPLQEPGLALNVWPSTRLPSTDGAAPVFDGRIPLTRPVGELVTECDPATLVAVTTTSTVSPINPDTSFNVEPVAFEISVHDSPAALHDSH